MKTLINKLIEMLKENKEQHENAARKQCLVWEGGIPATPPLLLMSQLEPSLDKSIPDFNIKEIHYDREKMFMNGLKEMLKASQGGYDAVPSSRANMGCGIFPTLFGIKQELFEDKMPWVTEHLCRDKIVKMGPEDIKPGDEFKMGLEHMQYMAKMLEGTGCHVFPMDLQGPFDTAHIVYGDQIFYDMFDEPGLVHHLLDLSCHAIIIGMEECLKAMPGSDRLIAHYNGLVMPRTKGGIKISEDTPTLLSKEQIDEFAAPYTKRILQHFGGGYIHYCGRNDHLFNMVMNEPLAYGLNFGNPEMHDMETVLKECAQSGRIYYGTGVNRKENESLFDYFSRCIRSSLIDGRNMLLFEYSCGCENRNHIAEIWEKAAYAC